MRRGLMNSQMHLKPTGQKTATVHHASRNACINEIPLIKKGFIVYFSNILTNPGPEGEEFHCTHNILYTCKGYNLSSCTWHKDQWSLTFILGDYLSEWLALAIPSLLYSITQSN